MKLLHQRLNKWMGLLVGVLSAFSLLGGGTDQPLAKWEKEMEKFKAEDKANPPPKGAVLFVGSSSIRLWKNLAEAFPKVTTIERGFGGSHLPDVIYYADQIVFPYEPEKIVLYAGDNDIAKGRTPEQILNDFKVFESQVRERLPETEIIFIAIKPSGSRWHLAEKGKEANRLIEEFANQRELVSYVDIWNPMLGEDGKPKPELFVEDQLHLNAKGYDLWRRLITPFLVSGAK